MKETYGECPRDATALLKMPTVARTPYSDAEVRMVGDANEEWGTAMSHTSRRFRALAFGAVSASALALFAAPAAAQFYPIDPPSGFGLMPAHEADAVVRSLGLTPIAPPRVHGPVILIDAIGQEGSQVRVTVDRRSGRVRQIVRFAPSAPQIATIQPRPRYEPDDDEPGFFSGNGPPPPPPYVRGQPGNYSGPQVITRDDIQSEDLPPPGAGPRVVTRDAEITNSVPRAAPRGPVDPLLGVPPEFRSRAARGEPTQAEPPKERLAARTPADSIPRIAPLPRPRPADAPSVAQRESAPAKAEAAKPPAPEPKAKSDEAPAAFPVQPLE
ncbi:MAG: hypothetical protein WD871_16570 [Xanthobacteraceae bacterium]